jgi:hypothetical protein
VGNAFGSSGTLFNGHAVLWTGTATSAIDLHPASMLSSIAVGVGANQQVGWGFNPNRNSLDALLWTGSVDSAIDLSPTSAPPNFGGASSRAFSTNGVQQVGIYGNHAFLWSGTAASAFDLQPLLPTDGFPNGIANSAADAIDAQGNVFGTAMAFNGETTQLYAVEWVAVPEPQSILIVAIAIPLLLWAARSRAGIGRVPSSTVCQLNLRPSE